jgi:regulator of protease activity HflC (stomatin/prohibitin superfamily)
MSQERKAWFVNGWLFLAIEVVIAIFLCSPAANSLPEIRAVLAVLILGSVKGYFILQPNHAIVCTLLGSYAGTVRENGFSWSNPFYARRDISLRLRNLEGAILKVNDKRGNPIEIGAIVVWHVDDTAKAVFDVENFSKYVELQSESCVRQIASSYPYDYVEHEELSLRNGGERIASALQSEIEQRLSKAGVKVDEARFAHLVYAPEIAMAMLRRQQAEALISARKQIVSGAVSIVAAALRELTDTNGIELDDERRAAMVSNLLVVLCSESQVQPVINTGTLYT